MSTDVRITDHGSVVAFTPLTPAAQEWIDANLETEAWQWLGPSLCVDHRYVANLVAGMTDAGLQVA